MLSTAQLSILGLIVVITVGVIFKNYSHSEKDLYALAETERLKLKLRQIRPLHVEKQELTSLFKHELNKNINNDLINVYNQKVMFEINNDTGVRRYQVSYPIPKRSCFRYVTYMLQSGFAYIKIDGHLIAGSSTPEAKQRIAYACQLKPNPSVIFAI